MTFNAKNLARLFVLQQFDSFALQLTTHDSFTSIEDITSGIFGNICSCPFIDDSTAVVFDQRAAPEPSDPRGVTGPAPCKALANQSISNRL